MPEYPHMIKTQRLDLTLRMDSRLAPGVQNTIGEIYKSQVIPVLNKVMDQFSRPGEIIRMERLELDLNQLNADILSEDFPRKVEAALRKALGDIIPEARLKHVGKVSSSSGSVDQHEVRVAQMAGSDIEALAYFLYTGQWPWYITSAQRPSDFNAWLRERLINNPTGFVPVLKDALQDPKAMRRCIYQCTPDLMMNICQVLAMMMPGVSASAAGAWSRIFHALETQLVTHKAFSKISRTRLHYTVWHPVVKLFIPGQASLRSNAAAYDALRKILVGLQAYLLPTSVAMTSRKNPWEKTLWMAVEADLANASADVLKGRKDDLRRVVAEQLMTRGYTDAAGLKPARKPGTTERLADHEVQNSMDFSGEKNETPGDKKNDPHSTSEKEDSLPGEDARPDGKEKRTNANKVQKELAELASKRVAEEKVDQELPARRPIVPDEVEEAPVSNAGLILFHPFIVHLMEGLGLAENKKFIHDEAREQAVHILQYLATGETVFSEDDMVLNKLLCGMHLEDPVPTRADLGKDVMEECDALIQHVVDQWSVLKNASADSVRQTFVRREGLLSKEGFGGGWKLVVERNTFDILLDRLPWGISMVKMPWNDFILNVEW